MVDGTVAGYDSYEDAISRYPAESLADEVEGMFMFYSSGTTGRPKGIARPLSDTPWEDETPIGASVLGRQLLGMTDKSVYLCPAPLYHAAPLGWSTTAQRLGATVVVMEKFDPVQCLELIERHRVTHVQFVPTHFIRMLKLPDEDRARFDHSSLQMVVHAAAPCPAEVKRQMIEWWGPILYEYYGGTELNGLTIVNTEEWLAHPGTVGKPILGTIHICDDEGAELPVGEPGLIYFEQPVMPFEYHHDPDKTRKAQHPVHPTWSKLGDVGYLDADGYLHLTDRKDFMIISGGVNIYPQEIENLLITHPKVADAAVVGAPCDEMGEKVVAVIQPLAWAEDHADLADELMAFARANLSHVKSPRRIDFMQELPRHATGKLYKRLIRDAYWADGGKRIG
jgi:acyl-CoA synthetase (AMP-forming)/AMP-acid ligase II